MDVVSRLALVSLVLALVLDSACVAAGALPPSRTDVGTTVIAGDGEMSSGFRVATGAHLASASVRRDFPVDVGAGYVYERLARSHGSPTSRETREMAAGDGSIATPTDVVDAGPRNVHGGYLEVAYTISRSHSHRSWLGARGELLIEDGLAENSRSTGLYARVAWELFAPSPSVFGGSTSGTAGGVGVAHGTAGLGLFVEAGAQRSEEDRSAFVATAGVSVRMPFLAGFFFDLCPRC
jgi:hypothetical protein